MRAWVLVLVAGCGDDSFVETVKIEAGEATSFTVNGEPGPFEKSWTLDSYGSNYPELMVTATFADGTTASFRAVDGCPGPVIADLSFYKTETCALSITTDRVTHTGDSQFHMGPGTVGNCTCDGVIWDTTELKL